MKRLFIDTAGWMMLADASDPRHRDAMMHRDAWLEQGAILVSTDYVMDETLTLIRVRMGIHAAERWWEQTEGSERLQWRWLEPEHAEKARGLFFRWRDKTFSFTDCTSFVVMRELRVKTALTSDRHFRRFGFEILP